MYGGGMVKLGRGGGGGRGGGKRPLPPPRPPSHIQRVGGPSPAAARLPPGSSSSRGRHGAGMGGTVGGVTAAAPEETYRMVSADNLDFAAIIRLTPDLVDVIRRLEAQGGGAKIKFDSNSNNHSGNVIDVGGKEFKFTWSRELGVCDIYEVQNGEDGNGLLSECGSAWRKLNVQRILDESLKNQVKMRSEEAERKLKSRRSIVLDPANPSVKSQAKTMAAAAVEGNMRRSHWKTDQLFKKRKSEPSMVSNPVTHKSVFKSGMSTNNSTGTTVLFSPQPLRPGQVGIGPSGSPFGMANHTRGHASMDEDAPLTSNVVDVTNSEMELANKPFPGTIRRLLRNKVASRSQPVDLRSVLINLLLDNPKGMSLKALEKAVVEAMPNSGKKIETIIKTIATYQAPGRYILKPGVDVESSRKPPYESGSSSEHPPGSLSVKEVMEKDNAENEDLEHKTHLVSKPVEPDNTENINIEQNSPDRSTVDRKVNKENEEGACSSSESGSDSDDKGDTGDSGSDSESQSRSRSKSQSPMGSGSASSSDSDSDGSSSSKEGGSDVDVDIMTSEDDKEETGNKLPTSSRLSSPAEVRPYNGGQQENVIGRGNLDSQGAASLIDSHDYVQGNAHALENASNEAKMKTPENFESATPKSIVSNELQMNGQVFCEGMTSQAQYQQPVLQSMLSVQNSTMDKSEHVGGHTFTDKQFIGKNCPDPRQFVDMGTMSKCKFKRVSNSKDLQEKPESCKRSQAAEVVQTNSGKNRDNNFAEKSSIKSPGRSATGQYGGQIMLSTKDVDWDRNTFNSLKEADTGLAGRHMVHDNEDGLNLNPDFHNANLAASDARQLHERAGGAILSGKAADGAERSGRHIDKFSRAGKYPEKLYGLSDESDTSRTRNMNSHDKFSVSKDSMHKDIQDVVSSINEKHSAKNIRDDTRGDNNPPSFPDTCYRRYDDQNGIQKDTKLLLNMHKVDVEKCAVNTEKGFLLRREHSYLELGEFREPSLVEDTKGSRRQFERGGAFKSSDSKVNVMDNFSSDSNMGRTPVKVVHESNRESPCVSKCGNQANQDGSYSRLSEGDVMKSTIPQLQINSSQVQQFHRTDRPEHDSVSHLDRLPDMAGRNETRTGQEIDQENYVASHKRASDSVLTQRATKHNDHMAGRTATDIQPQKCNGLRDTSDQSKENFWVESMASCVKRMEPSSDEDDLVYAKYDKDKAELRGPIKDYPQYKEYTQEFCEKYDCYFSLNRHLEKYRNEFSKVGCGLETSRERDKEAFQNISEQMVQMYLQCKKKHSQMRRIFVILHSELKVLKQRIKDFAEEYTRD